MSSSEARRKLRIDIFEKKEQEALALVTLTPPALIDAILQEFHELEYLSNQVAAYQLQKASDGTPLPDDFALGQLAENERLVLVERPLPAPSGARPPSQAIYLREERSNPGEAQSKQLYPLPWVPAIIGRPDNNKQDNALLAVNLEKAANGLGLRVSRRHARIDEENGRYFVSSLAPNNPIYHLTADDQRTLLTTAKHPLHSGDRLYLEGSELTLKFLVRE
ncbi:MAG: FHA domain-containing protein [Caldilineaceae bacterium]